MAEPDPVSIPSDCTELNENLPLRDGSETNEPYGSVLSERKHFSQKLSLKKQNQ